MKVDLGHNKTLKWGVYIEVADRRFWCEEEFDRPEDAVALRERVAREFVASDLIMPEQPKEATSHRFFPRSFMLNAPCILCGKRERDPVHKIEERYATAERDARRTAVKGPPDAEPAGGD